MHSTTPTSPPAPDLSQRDVRLAFGALVLAMLPAVIDQTILATALPTVARDLGALADVSLLVTAYVVAATAATPLWGKLADRHGPKPLLVVCLTVFVIASSACGLAADLTQLVLARIVQGFAAGGLMTLAMTAVGLLVEPRERGRYQGYTAAVFAVAAALGPLVGGVLVDQVSWRWVFYVNLPLGIAALAGIALLLPSRSAPAGVRRPLDAAGAALLAVGTVAILLASAWGGDRYAWDSAEIAGLGGLALVAALGWVVRERRASDPVVPLPMLALPSVGVASAGLFLGTASLFGVTVFVPLFLQATAGASPTEAGLLLVPMSVGITISTTLSGRVIARTGRYRRFPVAGLTLMSAALTLLAVLAPGHSMAATGAALVVFGLGFGMVSQVLLVAVQSSVERREIGTATAATSFFRALGGAAGAAALGAVFAAHLGTGPGADVTGAVQAVFVTAAVIAAVAVAVVTRLPERRL